LDKLRINLWQTISIKTSFSITNVVFPLSILIDDKFISQKAEPSMNRTFRGIKIDWSDENENANDSIRVNREFDSNEIDESDWHHEKHDEQRISTLHGRKIDRSDDFSNACELICVNRECDSNKIDESE
jgi:hypothetical protein